MSVRTYLQAISDGLREEMRRDERVFLIGEDIGVYGGAFKVTQGLQEEFGEWRVIDAPLAEIAIVESSPRQDGRNMPMVLHPTKKPKPTKRSDDAGESEPTPTQGA